MSATDTNMNVGYEELRELCAAAGVPTDTIEAHLSYWVTRLPLSDRATVRARAQQAALSDRLDDAVQAALALADDLQELANAVEAGDTEKIAALQPLIAAACDLLPR